MVVCGPGNVMVKIVAVAGTYSTCVIVQVLSTTSLHLTHSVLMPTDIRLIQLDTCITIIAG